MGTYLSQPNREKNCEEGEELQGDTPAAWGVVDMQGWRKTMEDAHLALAGVRPPGTLNHDQLHGKTSSQLAAVADSDVHEHIHPSNSNQAMVFAVFDGHGGPEVARFCQLYLLDVLTKQDFWNSPNPDVPQALISSFHALDRMIDDPERRDEIMDLKTDKPVAGLYRTVAPQATFTKNKFIGDSFSDEKKIDVVNSLYSPDPSHGPENGLAQAFDNAVDNDHYQECFSDEIPTHDDINPGDNQDVSDNVRVGINLLDEEAHDDLDQDDEDYDNLNQDVGDRAVALFKQLLYMNTSPSQDRGIVHFESRPSTDSDRQNLMVQDNTPETSSDLDNSDGRSVFQPTRIINGKQACNLPEHPIHAGCTAICAVLTGGILTVANAGDSRAVLCRAGGVVEPLSFDHKPTQERELTRIVAAGGFVNQFGRVNGNLNLSRSIGDLKYKQVPGIPPSGQMITAEPDITQFTLNERDEFIIMGCDGIWDCLTNEEAVAFVRQRIDLKTPVEIGVEMLDTIVSVDPRTTQGIGGDNMTIMIIDLMPQKRPYRTNSILS